MSHFYFFFLPCLCLTLTSSQLIGTTPWDTLNTTFPYFYGVPLTQSEAESTGWTSILTCNDANSPGNVYWYNNDLSSMPIFNADGNIAGIIIGIKDPGKTQHGRAPWMHYFYTDQSGLNHSFYGIEGIFRDPTSICTLDSSNDITFGDRLWIANGSHNTYNKIPLNENYCLLENNGWDEGGCKDGIYKMGVHYWRYISINGNCNSSYPIFLLYDNNILHAWGVAMGNYDRPIPNSTRWEHPYGSFLTSFFLDGEAPLCLAAQSKVFNSLHVYMTSSVLAAPTPCDDETENIINGTVIYDCYNSTSTNDNYNMINGTIDSSSGDGDGNNNDNDGSIEVIIGIIGAVCGIIVLLVIIGVCFRMRRRKKVEYGSGLGYSQF